MQTQQLRLCTINLHCRLDHLPPASYTCPLLSTSHSSLVVAPTTLGVHGSGRRAADTVASTFDHPRWAYLRLDFRITSFSPDQISSTAQTFTSTSPIGSATSRITSSVRSVRTPLAFFGQDTQTAPSCSISVSARFSSATSCALA